MDFNLANQQLLRWYGKGYHFLNETMLLDMILTQVQNKKHLRHIEYAVAHAQCLRPKVEADDRKFKAMQESFDKTIDMYMVIRYQHKIWTMNVYFCLEAIKDRVLTRLRQQFFKKDDEPWYRHNPDIAGVRFLKKLTTVPRR